jgi:phosphotriesterase-related protein
MERRRFLTAIAGITGAPAVLGRPGVSRAADKSGEDAKEAPRVMTVTGPVPADRLGFTLPHEHVMVDFVGADEVDRSRYERDEVVETVLPHLKRIRELGCRCLIDCTPAYLARDPVVLRRLSEASGLRPVTNTGYYGARDDQHLPDHTFEESADELAERWTREWRDGIDGTGIRPGFIKIGVDRGSLSEVDEKLVRAAARTHRQTGLTLAVHTGPAEAALEQLGVLEAEGVDPSAWIWVHAQAERNKDRHAQIGRRGGWVEFDGVRPNSIERHVELVRHMKDEGLLDRVLISQDAGWYTVGEPGGGDFRGYDTLQAEFLPALREAGLTDDEVRRLTVENPARAFGVRKRLRDD